MGTMTKWLTLWIVTAGCAKKEEAPTEDVASKAAPAAPAASAAAPAPPVASTAPAAPAAPEDVIDVTAQKLSTDYKANEISADTKYRGKLLRVSGKVAQIGKDVLDEPFVALATKDDWSRVHASFDAEGVLGTLTRGQRLTVRCRGKGLSLGSPLLVNCSLDPTKTDIAHAHAIKMIGEAYAAWREKNPKRGCPNGWKELTPFLTVSTLDPWGNDYRVSCNSSAAPAKRMRAQSNGPDGKPDTADDIKSWE